MRTRAEHRTKSVPTVPVTVRIPAPIAADVDLLAQSEGVSVSDVYRDALWGRWSLSEIRERASAIRAESAA